MTKESFLRGAAILATASLLNRIIGVIYMVVLPRLIFDEGMGLYQLVKPVHYFAAVLAISGLPLAISKLVAESAARGSAADVQRVFSTGLTMMVATGSAVALSLILGSPFLATTFTRDPGMQTLIAILGPACFFLSLSAAFRGFFQGLQQMLPTAVSQLVDQVVRVSATVFFALRLQPLGIERSVLGIGYGFVFGELSGWLVLLSCYFSKRKALLAKIRESPRAPRPKRLQLVGRLLTIAIPAVTATVFWPIMQLADSILIPVRMQEAGFTADVVREGLGHFGMALTLSQLPNIITVALATSLVPAIAEAWALGKSRLLAHRSQEALRVSLVFGLPAFAFLYVFAKPLGEFLFGYGQVASFLKVLAIGTVTLGLIQSTTGILQGLGDMIIPVRNLFCGVVLKFTLNYLLVGHPAWGVLGAAWATSIGWALVACLNLYAVFRRVGVVIHARNNVLKPILGTLSAAGAAFFLQTGLGRLLPGALALVFSISTGLGIYFLLLVLWGTIRAQDVSLIPLIGKPLGRTLQAWGFLRK